MNAKRILVRAMLELLKTNKFENITVQMILDESSISRTTFYRCFRDKYDLMSWYYRSYAETLFNEDQIWHDFTQSVYQFIYDNKQYFSKLLSKQEDSSFRDFFHNFSFRYSENAYLKKVNRTELTEKEKVELEFYIAGSVFVVEEWVRNGFKEPVSDIVNWVCELTPKQYRCFRD